MHPLDERALLLSRRHFFGRAAAGIGTAALGSLLARDASATERVRAGGLKGLPHLPVPERRADAR
ncbi:Uncharacterized protein OS=uncultured bacterium Lac161 PE=4 SV=1 [Gemmata massiliana]|uniref:Sulfatase n=1 Tax=Gemmata massiliana TaxID=1210884 RepID=A0A6P2CVY5_9BACT|nr:twin-arginine translocation signal domain-containing protein [Gemmata massiliana]VTR92325.1 Uncharacterized protein OS=uncultured bacterium Lac161 PE=4 SV=1 [Gemmata massiliana]